MIAIRVGAIAAIVGVDVAPLATALALVDPLLARPLEVTWRADAAALGIVARVGPADRALVGRLHPALATAIGDTECELEVRTVAGEERSEAAVRSIGAPDFAARLAALGVLPAALAPLPAGSGGLVARVSAGELAVEVGRVVRGPEGAVAVAALAELAGVSAPQRALIAKLHPVLARDLGAFAALTILEGGARAPRLALRYAAMPCDLALRFIGGLYRGDAAARIGAFAGATGAAHVSALELVLGPTEPLAAWIQCPSSNQVRA
ncbi:MAG: hypothetical protein NT062_38170 [Proteobacteria bacterium]|nr:hypothetical protein [Pseudomonadota bacterium]